MKNINFTKKLLCTKSFRGERYTLFVFCVFCQDQYLGPQDPKSPQMRSAEPNFGPTLTRSTQNIDFSEKCKTVTNIIFQFYGGLPFNILLKNGPFSHKLRFVCQNWCRPQRKIEHRCPIFDRIINFTGKLSMTMFFSSL